MAQEYQQLAVLPGSGLASVDNCASSVAALRRRAWLSAVLTRVHFKSGTLPFINKG